MDISKKPITPPPAKPLYQPDPEEVTVFGLTTYRRQLRRFGIKLDDRRRHMYLIGKTGMGKSTMLENMIISDIRNGKGIALVDPHGDLVEKVVKFIPDNRINDVVYFNPSDADWPMAFNIVESVNPEHKNLIASGLVGVFKKIWADSWGPRLEYILINTILALLDYPGSTLLGVTRLLVDKTYRKKVVSEIRDPVVKSFWVDEYANYSEKFRTEAIAPIQNKVGQFLSSSIIRNIVGQSKSTIDMREVMDSGKILLMNLSKGRIGEENAALLGAMMITKVQLAAMSRVDIPENDRRDFYLYVDEFQNFATDSFANILSEARKYRLNLIMAHQYIEQLGDVVKAAVFGNVGTMVVFRIGSTDAAEFETEFEPIFTPTDILNLPKYHVYMKLMIDGVASDPFSATSLPPVTGETSNLDKILRASRERYAHPRLEVEDKIMRWAGMVDESAAGAGSLGIAARPGLEDEEEQQPEKIPTLNPREFKERMKLMQGSDQKLVPELAQTPQVAAASSISLMDALKSGNTVSFGGKPVGGVGSTGVNMSQPKNEMPAQSSAGIPQVSVPQVSVPGAVRPQVSQPSQSMQAAQQNPQMGQTRSDFSSDGGQKRRRRRRGGSGGAPMGQPGTPVQQSSSPSFTSLRPATPKTPQQVPGPNAQPQRVAASSATGSAPPPAPLDILAPIPKPQSQQQPQPTPAIPTVSAVQPSPQVHAQPQAKPSPSPAPSFVQPVSTPPQPQPEAPQKTSSAPSFIKPNETDE